MIVHPHLDIDIPQDIPAWLPETDLHAVSGKTVEVQLTRGLINRMKSPVKITISEWAQAHRIVMPIDSNPGPWRQDKVPHTVKIMDTIGKPWVREVWMCMVERSGKTQVLLNSAMWSIDQGMKSGNIFWLMPTELDARTALGERIIPALRASHATRRHMSERSDDTSRGIIRFKHGIRLKPAWSNSPASLASYFGRFNIADETDKYADRTSEGTDPITLFMKRSRDDKRGSKYVFASTPGQKYIYKGMKSCQQVWEYRVKCPDCGEYILMDGEHFVIPSDATPDTIHHAVVQYACNSCATLWTENDRDNAYQAGRWFCIKGDDLLRPETVGFHFPAFPCPMVPFAEIAGARLKAASGDIIAKSAWANGYEAVDYTAENKDRQEDVILALRDDRPRDVVPRGAQILTMQVDTQARGFWYVVRAWGWGSSLPSWKVRSGYLESFDDVLAVAGADYHDADGKLYRVAAGIIDSGGGSGIVPQHSRTAEVYEFCRANPLFRPVKGRRGGDPWSVKRMDFYPSRDGKKRPIPGGLNLYTIDTTLWKDTLASKLAIAPDDPGAFLLDADTGDDYARQMCVEYKDGHHWECPRGKDNHMWDVEVYGLALADMLQLRLRKQDSHQPTRRILSKGVNANG